MKEGLKEIIQIALISIASGVITFNGVGKAVEIIGSKIDEIQGVEYHNMQYEGFHQLPNNRRLENSLLELRKSQF